MASDLAEKNKALVHWDVIQDEATEEQSKSGAPMFGKTFTKYK
jgi:predicted SnoaL-like aldol condensation-catalyzing enzyme